MQKIIDVALTYVGYKENPSGSNLTVFGKWFGLNGRAWCGIFASFCYSEAGYPLGTIDFKKGFASCSFALAHFQKTGEVVPFTEARPGDLLYFDWDGDGRPNHVALFYKQGDVATDFVTIEGNTGVGNDSNGGEVMIRLNSRVGTKGARELPTTCKIWVVHPKVLDKAEATIVV